MTIYLTSDLGYNNYCHGCPCLVNVESTGRPNVTKRVTCSIEKCSKPTKEAN